MDMHRRQAIRAISAACAGIVAHSWGAHAASLPGKLWYVDQRAAPGGDGKTWRTAFQSPRDALAAASAGDEIWVAHGTYHPHPDDATQSFTLKADVALYGGFAGGETARDQRDYAQHVTTLSGDIGNGERTRNTHTIVMGADRAVLDGFTIAHAYGADKPRLHLTPDDILKGDMVVGGGMRNFMTSPVVRNCIFRNNFSPKGGAVYNVHKPGAEQATFTNVEFVDNEASQRGGAVSNDLGAMPVFIDCRFVGNRSQDKGGAIYNDFASTPLLFNVLVTGNEATTAGGIGNDGGSSPLLANVTIVGNKATSGLGAGLYQGTGANNNPIVVNCSIDDVYNWHEDIVAALGSHVPAGQTLPLADFLPISNLDGQVRAADLAPLPTGVGYQPRPYGAQLLKAPVVATLVQFYSRNEGVVEYRGEYTRPVVTRDAVAAKVIHVVPASASATQDGLSWATALTDLQAAIDLASVSKAAVWVKAGRYHPARRDADRIAAFTLYDGVEVYGGFAGTETDVAQRRRDAAPTVLSAKLAAGDDRYPHVVYGANQAVLDGLTIRDGNAVGFTYNGKGGGLLAYHAGKTYLPNGLKAYRAGRALESYSDPVGFTMTVRNCRFERNEALEGGAIYAFGKAVLTIVDTTFDGNRAIYGGAVLDREGVTATHRRSAFLRNAATHDGGGAYADYGSLVTFRDTRLQANAARRNGGAIYMISRASQVGATNVTVTNGELRGNTAAAGASIYDLDGGTLSVVDTHYPSGSIHQPKS